MALPYHATPATINEVFSRMQSDLKRPLTEEEKQGITQRINSGEVDAYEFLNDTKLTADELGGGKNDGNWFNGYKDHLDGKDGRRTHMDFINDRIAAHAKMLGVKPEDLSHDEKSNIRSQHMQESKKLVMGVGARSALATEEWTTGQRNITDGSSAVERAAERVVQGSVNWVKERAVAGQTADGYTVGNMTRAFIRGGALGAVAVKAPIAAAVTLATTAGTWRAGTGAIGDFVDQNETVKEVRELCKSTLGFDPLDKNNAKKAGEYAKSAGNGMFGFIRDANAWMKGLNEGSPFAFIGYLLLMMGVSQKDLVDCLGKELTETLGVTDETVALFNRMHPDVKNETVTSEGSAQENKSAERKTPPTEAVSASSEKKPEKPSSSEHLKQTYEATTRGAATPENLVAQRGLSH